MIKPVTVVFILFSSLNVLAADPVITSDVENQSNVPNGPVVNMGSPPQDTFFSFGKNTPNNNPNNNLAGGFARASSANLFSYESIISSPDSSDSNNNDNISIIINAGVESVMPTGFSIHGGFSFLVRDSFETAFNAGARFYSGMPIFNTSTPTFSYIGVGMLFVNGSTFYPEVGIRLAPSSSIRMDIYFKAYTSSDPDYDRRAAIGLGLSF